MIEANELQEKLQALGAAYAAQLPEKIGQIEQAWKQFPHDDWDEESFATLHRMVHSLTGSGKTFGFALLSDVARSLENHLAKIGQEKAALNEEQCTYIQVLISELYQVAAFRDTEDIAGLNDVVQISRHVTDRKMIFMVEDDCALAESLRIQLNYFGYDVSVFNTLADFNASIQADSEVVVLMDISFPEDSLGGINFMKEFQRQRSVPLPVIFITAHNDFATRLDAVRAGGIAFLNKPVNIGNLIDKLDALNLTSLPELYRVLVVDDSEAITAYYAAVLEHAGMTVRTVNNPFDVMGLLFEFVPDLILLDIYMPGCNGLELAKVIRQLDDFVSIPIVFLSAEGNLDKQLFAMGLGGDDFLTKPIQPQHLVSSVSSRVRRSRVLRSLMVRDSLTGLLNHTAIKGQLDREVARAIRQGTRSCFAMIDIDHFKQVNDTYGHPAGDRVIKSLARQLKQRLRVTDMIGRYGGEEFAVVLCDTDGAGALQVLDNIRKDFSQLRHMADGKEFSASFSCGIAEVSHYDNPNRLCDEADMALYKAKHAGRNRVILADAQAD